MRQHRVWRGQDILITTTNDDTLTGRVTWTDRDGITLAGVHQITADGRAPLAGVVTIMHHGIAWLQVHHQAEGEG